MSEEIIEDHREKCITIIVKMINKIRDDEEELKIRLMVMVVHGGGDRRGSRL